MISPDKQYEADPNLYNPSEIEKKWQSIWTENNLYKNYKTNKIFDIKKICNRQFGIGADGVIFIEEPNEDNYAKMIIFNADGSEAQMCGNGIRCLVEYLHVNDSMKNKNIEYKIETKAGLKIAK